MRMDQPKPGWAQEDELLPISALQHLMFCERQCALIHIEQLWRENPLTLEGSRMHARVDEGGPRRESRGDVVIVRGLPLRSFRLGLAGRADVVEFRRYGGVADAVSEGPLPRAGPVPELAGLWTPFPVDYKRGRPKRDLSDAVQLCAQGLCLEEMLGISVPGAALFYGRLKHRHDVRLDHDLRAATEAAAARLRQLLGGGATPRAVREPKCRRCSLLPVCKPEAMSSGRSARRYVRKTLGGLLDEQTLAP